jgi:hypothetical protein
MSEMIEPREFVFDWQEDGCQKSTTIFAESYAEACWRLGLFHAERFRRLDIPKEFKLEFPLPEAATR